MTNPANPVPPSPVGSPAPGYPWPPAAMPAPEPKRSWFARHKILTGIGAFVAVGIVASALNGGGGAGESSAAVSSAAQSTTQSVASAAPRETAGQDAAPAPSPEQTTPA